MGNPAYALEVLQPMMNSSDPTALQMIAGAYARLNQTQQAIDYMRKAQAAGNKDPGLASGLALADISQKNTSQGKAAKFWMR